MIQSILNSTKKNLGLAADYDEFDDEVLMQINSAFSTLNQLGVGPENGFMIEDDGPEWGEYLQGINPNLNNVKNFVFMTVRLAFDPPETSYGISAVERQLEQLAWRIEVAANPRPPVLPREAEALQADLELVIDGGSA